MYIGTSVFISAHSAISHPQQGAKNLPYCTFKWPKHPWRVLQTPLAIAWGKKGRALPNLGLLLFPKKEKDFLHSA